ncbi:MAG: prepilin peptidase [Acetobacteraceae bacterium]|nr:prepilin peptidase [Acetobacteraceae bacterium]
MTALPLASVLTDTITLLAAFLLILAAGCDVLTRLIPNPIPLGLAVLGLSLRVIDGSWPWALLAAGIVGGLALLCWLRGWMGGGDMKLLAACALLVPPMSVFPMVTTVGMAGGGLAVIYMLARRLVPRPAPVPPAQRPRGFLRRALRAERWRLARGAALPYAVAIAIGSLTTVS